MARLTQKDFLRNNWVWVASQLVSGKGQRRTADRLGINVSLLNQEISRFLEVNYPSIDMGWQQGRAEYEEDRMALLWGAIRGKEIPPVPAPYRDAVIRDRRRPRLQWKPPMRRNLGRPLDMGGPRDVWMTFLPGPDPRFDFMEPVEAEQQGQAAA